MRGSNKPVCSILCKVCKRLDTQFKFTSVYIEQAKIRTSRFKMTYCCAEERKQERERRRTTTFMLKSASGKWCKTAKRNDHVILQSSLSEFLFIYLHRDFRTNRPYTIKSPMNSARKDRFVLQYLARLQSF